MFRFVPLLFQFGHLFRFLPIFFVVVPCRFHWNIIWRWIKINVFQINNHFWNLVKYLFKKNRAVMLLSLSFDFFYKNICLSWLKLLSFCTEWEGTRFIYFSMAISSSDFLFLNLNYLNLSSKWHFWVSKFSFKINSNWDELPFSYFVKVFEV